MGLKEGTIKRVADELMSDVKNAVSMKTVDGFSVRFFSADERVLRYIVAPGIGNFSSCIALAIGATRLLKLLSSEDFIRYQ